MDEGLFIIPIIITFSYWIAGLRSNWWKTLILVLISYSAVILAFQNFRFIAGLVSSLSGRSATDNQTTVLGFGIGLLFALIGLYVLYGVLWNPKASPDREPPRGEVRFLLSIVSASCGWVLGMLFLICIFKFSYPTQLLPINSGTGFLWDAMRTTINFTNHFVSPWLIQEAPRFLSGIF